MPGDSRLPTLDFRLNLLLYAMRLKTTDFGLQTLDFRLNKDYPKNK
ncbi:hypothetical protein SAMN04488023_1052 [Pedobacter rhizosphaerae]|uniref:Uncharacterized protein n=1 Tax=Pedobacter rhizosphaerae TaxID=390241 RepID=A0A1H9LX57_9SPHI|nr:hypothetical protein SAMN04488023_1052 [Pedobacter rhizosphaerae]